MNVKADEIVAGIGVIVFFIVAILAFTLWNAWAITFLWAWFVVPVFHLPYLGYWQAAGLALTVHVIKPSRNKDSKGALLAAIAGPPIAVAFGWLIKTVGGL